MQKFFRLILSCAASLLIAFVATTMTSCFGFESPEEELENTDDCLTVEEARAMALEEFRSNVKDKKCNDVVFFYSKRNVEDNYDDGGLEAMLQLDGVIVYEDGCLADAIKDFINKGQ